MIDLRFSQAESHPEQNNKYIEMKLLIILNNENIKSMPSI